METDCEAMDRNKIKVEIDMLVSSLAACADDGCRCWQAREYLRQIVEYASKEAGPKES